MDDAKQALRDRVQKLLSGGLATIQEPMPESNQDADAIIDELSTTNDVEKKLVIAGFDRKAHDYQRCKECMYYLTNAKWCDLPVLDLPAEDNWWCRLWRI